MTQFGSYGWYLWPKTAFKIPQEFPTASLDWLYYRTLKTWRTLKTNSVYTDWNGFSSNDWVGGGDYAWKKKKIGGKKKGRKKWYFIVCLKPFTRNVVVLKTFLLQSSSFFSFFFKKKKKVRSRCRGAGWGVREAGWKHEWRVTSQRLP